MPFWNPFARRSPVKVHADLVWLTPPVKHRGLVLDWQRRTQTGLSLVAAHFPETLAVVEAEFDNAGIEFDPQSGPIPMSEFDRRTSSLEPQPIMTSLVDWLPTDDLGSVQTDDSAHISILIAERHFLADRDADVLQFAAGLRNPCDVQFHISVGDPLLAPFAGEQLRDILKAMGLDDREAIRLPFVNRRVRHAQRHFAKHARSDGPAKSPSDWLDRHCPTLASSAID
ncbi:hypothetical protein [Thalassoroseus pseudoceratinae]|uniref:hypothetical protein n=1 Tax=Thalassoroseus pseudoceratinae TaxID=2713176 RepID=UPI0014233463|nr:hypothetical protein [Thalassoroseus pseudoceratinae]